MFSFYVFPIIGYFLLKKIHQVNNSSNWIIKENELLIRKKCLLFNNSLVFCTSLSLPMKKIVCVRIDVSSLFVQPKLITKSLRSISSSHHTSFSVCFLFCANWDNWFGQNKLVKSFLKSALTIAYYSGQECMLSPDFFVSKTFYTFCEDLLSGLLFC